MTWSTLPTFADGSTVDEDDLNALSDNIQYLYEVTRQVNPPCSSLRLVGGSLDNNPFNFVYWMYHRHQYLHYYIIATSDPGEVSEFRIYCNYPTETDPAYNPATEEGTHRGALDLANITDFTEPTIGTWYPIHFEITSADELEIIYIFESPSSDYTDFLLT